MFLISFLLGIINIYSLKVGFQQTLNLIMEKVPFINLLNNEIIIKFDDYLEDLNQDIFSHNID